MVEEFVSGIDIGILSFPFCSSISFASNKDCIFPYLFIVFNFYLSVLGYLSFLLLEIFTCSSLAASDLEWRWVWIIRSLNWLPTTVFILFNLLGGWCCYSCLDLGVYCFVFGCFLCGLIPVGCLGIFIVLSN